MRINYKILWLDDDKDFLDKGREEIIKAYLESKGFNPQIQHYYSVKEAEVNKENYDKYDLILSDFNLEPDQSGAYFINLIRNKKIITEILLYSANKIDYNKIVLDYGYLDRVTICDNIRNINNVIEKIIDITIKKTQDISSLRGLIMSETTEIDSYIEEMIEEMSKDKMLGEIVYRNKIALSEKIKGTLNSKYKLIDDKKYDRAYKDSMIFSAKYKYDLLINILNEISNDEDRIKDLIKGITGYEKIVIIRNKFGHCKQEMREDGTEYLKIKDEEKEFDEDECIKLRISTRDYFINFKKIHEYIPNIIDEISKKEEVTSS